MGLKQAHRDHGYLLESAQRLLGKPVRAVNFAWEIEKRLAKRLQLVGRVGLTTPEPVVEFDTSQSGIDVDVGMQHFRLRGTDPPLDLVRVHGGYAGGGYNPLYDFWAVAVGDYDRLRAHVRRSRRRGLRQPPPIMDAPTRQRLWDSSVGFLKRSVGVLTRYGVVHRRGVLLTGQPGNGKTMASRWLRDECRRHRLAWRTIAADEYEAARANNQLRELFHLSRTGIIQFDDLDAPLRDRESVGTSAAHTTLLTELDGVESRHGIVYLFTSNVGLDKLDPAFRRCGRIDQIIEFAPPGPELRQRLVEETWHEDIQSALDVRAVVRETDGLSFADLEEVKKLLVLGFLDSGEWDWTTAWEAFRASRGRTAARPIGFQQRAAEVRPDSAMRISARHSAG